MIPFFIHYKIAQFFKNYFISLVFKFLLNIVSNISKARQSKNEKNKNSHNIINFN